MHLVAQEAATALNVGVTTLKKACRAHKIPRWPFRKRNSIDKLIKRTKQILGQDEQGETVQALEVQRYSLKVTLVLARSSGIHA